MSGGGRRLEPVRALWGAWVLAAPSSVLRALGARDDPRAVTVARLLGARHLAQACLSGTRPTPEVIAMGVWVDAVHALTALALAALDRGRSRAGLVDAAVALTWGAVGYVDLRQVAVPDVAHDDWRETLARHLLHHLPGGRSLADTAARRRPTTH